jgi:glycosyltransferase involved in cell wall biosynthesis
MTSISVLLPVRNGEATLLQALESLWGQSFSDFEVVVVDDGSTDATPDLLAACHDPRLRIISIPPLGIAAALNEGLRHCRGPLVARMDADDTAHPERLERQRAYFQQHPEVDVLACCVEFGGDALTSQGYALYVAAINELLNHEQMWRRRFWDAPLAHPSVMYRKQVVLDAGGYSQAAVPEDYELWLRLFARGHCFAKLPEKLLQWNDHEKRLSRNHPNYSKKAFWRLKAQYFARWLEEEFGAAPPPVYVWGETNRKQRSRYLLEEGISIAGRIHYSSQPAHHEWIPYTDVPGLKSSLILVYVSNRKGQEQIVNYLEENGFAEGENYFLMV